MIDKTDGKVFKDLITVFINLNKKIESEWAEGVVGMGDTLLEIIKYMESKS